MTAVRRWITMIGLALLATSVLAQTPRTTTKATEPVTAATDKDLNDPNALKLSLQDALTTTIERNLNISLQNFDYRMAAQSLRSQYGLYDWFANAGAAYENQQGAVISRTEPNAQTQSRYNFGVSQNLPAGGNYSLGFNSARSTTSGGFTTVSPSYTPNLAFQLTQPLLRNFGLDVTQRGILIARNTLGINREAFRLALMDSAVDAEIAYWDLVYARRNVEVTKEALFLARDQSRITQIRIDVGASAPLDILQPRVQIATTESGMISAVTAVRRAEDRLRQVLNLPPDQWNRPIIPTDPAEFNPTPIDVNAAVSRAFDLRPELREALLTTKTRQVQYVYARNQTLPQLDLQMNYRAAGVGGREATVDPTTGDIVYKTTPYSTALNQVFSNDFPNWTLGLNFGIPILNVGARAEARRAQLDIEQSRVSEEQTRQTIVVNVRNAALNVDAAAQQISATRTAREAADQNLEAERRRYENGMTTNFQVLQIQQQLSDARVREIQALVGYNEALAQYHRQVGDILEVHRITVDEPNIVQEPQIFSSFDRYNWLNYGDKVNVNPPVEDKNP